MQFEADFRLEVDDNFSMCSQAISCPSTGTSFSSASSAYDPFTPNSRRSTPNQLSLDFDGGCNTYGNPQSLDLAPPTMSMPKYALGHGHDKTEPEHMSYAQALPTTPMKRMEHLPNDYDHLLDLNNMAQQPQVGSITPSNSFNMYTLSPEGPMASNSFMMTPTQSLSGSEIADAASSWSCTNDSPINFYQQRSQLVPGMEGFDMHRPSMSPMGRYHHHLHGSISSDDLRNRRIMMEAQRKTNELQRAQFRASRKRAPKPESASVDVVRRAMCKCDYPGCEKAFRRNEHLKRHKQTFHGEGPNRFPCEFCGKDQFNRRDNLDNHRKLHARPNSRNRGVEYIPAAVAIIEQEERSRKRRAPSKAKTERRGDVY
ncbi:hypothetical protein S40285_07086 [Stachybotrys chlorohalonatus IBT 40285]|uniref:C2H2-type domain-containing protein n=1 Tax=Stachybotrys chlorohalonatus (strain IBT 40285) TaxID=1283841 RepID=A0A084QD27_STAC4|nr:hypothetical protein S40285_07086 [Stachybotrys chlorohalonata IBT 40285]